MIPRLQIDVGWRDLAFALGASCRSQDADEAIDALEARLSPERRALVALSVRSGFDALLQTLALPPGSEVVMTSITIPHMVELVERHGLRVVPVAVDPSTLAVAPAALERAMTPATRLIVVTHLLGSRAPMAAIAAIASRYRVPVVEDAAQAFQGDDYVGDPCTAVTMFSFGPIKTATSLGGAVMYCRDPDLAAAVRSVLRSYPGQSRVWFARRALRFSLAKLLSHRAVFTPMVVACRALGWSYDRILRDWVRGFRGGDLLPSIRRAPPAPLIALLSRRLATSAWPSVCVRQSLGEHLARCLTVLDRPGRSAAAHSYWVFPVLIDHPERRAAELARLGFDTTTAASTLVEILPADDGGERCTLKPLAWLYLPQPGTMTVQEQERLAAMLSACCSAGAPSDHNGHA